MEQAASCPKQARQFAVWVVQQLRQAGYEALWAGGCVRDGLLGLRPKDYDVATNATPDEIRRCFGFRRTIPIGAAFGVITVVGRREEGQIEVATFRRDVGYSDGRHPDRVEFSDAREDALRRDFTINGLFFDPLAEQVIDYVGGQQDLRDGVVRAIGDPHARIAEDKLRMLRAVRFTATFGFRLDPDTAAAVRERANQLAAVSPERIAAELRRMLEHAHRAQAVQLLRDLSLLGVVLPEAGSVLTDMADTEPPEGEAWSQTLKILRSLPAPTFRTALAGWLWAIAQQGGCLESLVEEIGRRWRLANAEWKGTLWLLTWEPAVRRGHELPWPRVQPLLVDARAAELVMLAESVVQALDEPRDGLEFCRAKLELCREELDPLPLITGTDLLEAGLASGPLFQAILAEVRDRQLLGQLNSRTGALELARELAAERP